MSSCDCEPAQLYNSKIVRCRKPHKCLECGVKIEPGEQAEKVDSLYDGQFSTFYTCPECLKLIAYIRSNIKSVEICCHGELAEAIWHEGSLVWDDDDMEEEYSTLPFYDEVKGIVRGRNLPIATRVDWLIIERGRFRLNPTIEVEPEVEQP
ncbi:hypothetical protein [Pantanalinema sp. GBBB05]|uniref:hypothetical protein n=1 Tax=Pantanalinema sp. GBBB05 TaxID=2604139 RepID=UPI001DD2D0A1|nr:hypothetical protein [Pantanalinema sp. GBBB05]